SVLFRSPAEDLYNFATPGALADTLCHGHQQKIECTTIAGRDGRSRRHTEVDETREAQRRPVESRASAAAPTGRGRTRGVDDPVRPVGDVLGGRSVIRGVPA